MTGDLIPSGTLDLRQMVREVLGEVLGHTPGATPPRQEAVVLRDDADLQAFVRRLLAMLEDPATRAEVKAGRIQFRLDQSEDLSCRTVTEPVHRVERGVVTERQVAAAAAAGARLVLGRRAVLTPLARDKIRSTGIAVEREEATR